MGTIMVQAMVSSITTTQQQQKLGSSQSPRHSTLKLLMRNQRNILSCRGWEQNMALRGSCICVLEGELKAWNLFVRSSGRRPGRIVGYLGKYTKLLVCFSFFFLVIFTRLILISSTDGVSLLRWQSNCKSDLWKGTWFLRRRDRLCSPLP